MLNVCFADEFILPPYVPFMVQPPAFYTLVAEFEARGFDTTSTVFFNPYYFNHQHCIL